MLGQEGTVVIHYRNLAERAGSADVVTGLLHEAVDMYSVTVWYLISSIYRRLLVTDDLDEYDFSSVRLCGYEMSIEI
jgi:hypothetical protein